MQAVSENKKLALQYKRLERTQEKVHCKDVNCFHLDLNSYIIFEFNHLDDFLFLQLQKTKELTASLSNEVNSLVSNLAC